MADKITSIKIEFNGISPVGTIARVSFNPSFYKFWKKPYTKNYICTEPARLTNSGWVEIETGLCPNERVVYEIIDAAQAAARLAGLSAY